MDKMIMAEGTDKKAQSKARRLVVGAAIAFAGCAVAVAGSLVGIAFVCPSVSIQFIAEALLLSVMAGALSLPLQALVCFVTRNSRLRVRVPSAAAASAFCVAAVIGFVLWERSPRQLFKRVVVSPVPASVQILHCREDPVGFDTVVRLHFRCSPEDLRDILACRPFGEEAAQEERYVRAPGEPDWWNPGTLEGVRCYRYEERPGSVDYVVWTNATGTEAFYCYADW